MAACNTAVGFRDVAQTMVVAKAQAQATSKGNTLGVGPVVKGHNQGTARITTQARTRAGSKSALRTLNSAATGPARM
jgi:hypothetical protein